MNNESSSKTAFWTRHIEAWKDRDVSIVKYCETESLARSAFGYWRKKLSAPKPPDDGFLKLKIPAHRSDRMIYIRLRIGIECFLQARIPHYCKVNSSGSGWGIVLLPHERVFHPVALSVKYQQVAIVDQAVDHRGGHRLVEEYVHPLAELQVGGEDQAAFLIAG